VRGEAGPLFPTTTAKDVGLGNRPTMRHGLQTKTTNTWFSFLSFFARKRPRRFRGSSELPPWSDNALERAESILPRKEAPHHSGSTRLSDAQQGAVVF